MVVIFCLVACAVWPELTMPMAAAQRKRDGFISLIDDSSEGEDDNVIYAACKSFNRLLYYCRGDVIIFVILSEGGGRVEGSFGR